MNTADFLKSAAEAIRDDRFLSDWCQVTYGRLPRIFVGIDYADPPPAEMYPLVCLLEAARAQADDAPERRNVFVMRCGVYQEAVAVDGVQGTQSQAFDALLAGGRLAEFLGMAEAVRFRELCEDALYRARLGQIDTDGLSEMFEDYPAYIASSLVTLKTVKSKRKALP